MSLTRRALMAGGGSSFVAPVEAVPLLALYNGTGDGGVTYAIGSATFDGATWTKNAGNPIFEKTTAPAWDEDGVKDPILIYDGTLYHLFFAGYKYNGPDVEFRIGHATATSWADVEAGTFTRDPSPVVGGPASVNGSLDDDDAQAPFIYYSATPIDGHSWWMWYVGNGSNFLLAHSDDGEAWTGDGAVDAVGPVVYHGGTFYMLAANFGLNLWTFTTPTGTMTADGGNPQLEARSAGGAVSNVLTANASAGATSLTVGAGTLDDLEVGEPLWIVDANTGPEVNEAASVASTTIGLASPLLFGYTTADGATIRPLAYTLIDVRSLIRRADGTWEAFGTCIRPGDGLTFSGSELWEGTLRYTAPAITGPWSYDNVTGLVFPLGQPGDAWDSVSAENPSVIVAPE